jgi:hypothetical protein
MPKLTLEVPHALGQEEAARRLKEKLAKALAEHQSQITHFRDEWKDHSFSFAFQALGMAISGKVAIEQTVVKLAAELPFAASFFKRAIEDRLRQEVSLLVT